MLEGRRGLLEDRGLVTALEEPWGDQAGQVGRVGERHGSIRRAVLGRIFDHNCYFLSLTHHGGSRHLSRDDLLLHLLGESILQGEVVPSVDKQLVFEVLRRVEILARRLLPVAAPLQEHLVMFRLRLDSVFVSKALYGINLWKSPLLRLGRLVRRRGTTAGGPNGSPGEGKL